jgi:DNA-binding NtrC family response regulator
MHSAGSLTRFGLLYGSSPPMTELYRQAARVAVTDATVLLMGESGTGKELLAQTLHQLSPRRNGPYIAINCGAISPQLIESALFGHEKGSFTGALHRHAGYFEQASHGTLFLDEITDMPIDMQVKLLRVLENGVLTRIGGHGEIKTDVRVIAASNRKLDAVAHDGGLRADLMYRLLVFPLYLPPLRERGMDIDLLAQHFLDELNTREQTHKALSRNMIKQLHAYAWPGNVRELKNLVRRAYILSGDAVEIDEAFSAPPGEQASRHEGCLNFTIGTPLATAERELILATLKYYEGNKRLAADVLGISLKTLYNRLREQ